MANKVYNKPVRDLIPEIIKADGKTCRTEILPDDVYLNMLDKKLDEETAEYRESKSMEELADAIEAIRREKAEKRGGFDKKILLVDVQE